MSQAQLQRTRRGLAGGRVKKYRFSPGRLERLTLHVWRIPRSEGLIRAKLEGEAYVACGLGNEHYPHIEIEAAGHPRNADSATLIAALNGDEDAATELAEELEGHALYDWFDPCSAEGLDEEGE